MKRAIVMLTLVVVAMAGPVRGQTQGSAYQVVENWAQFPEGVTAWSSATGVDIDSKGNIYVFHRNESMPIMAFDRHGKFLRAWGQGMFKTTHFLRTDHQGNVWVTDELLSKVVDGASGGDLILPDSVDEFHIFNDLSQAAVAL